MSLSESDESLFDDLEFNAPDAPAAPPPARWESVDVDGKRKRRCLWKDADGGVCGKVVGNTNQVFERHSQTHTGERPFKCDLCAYTCIRSFDLTTHKRRHAGEKPFLCDKCDKKFAQSGDLTQHKRTHSGEKPFKCDNCDKTFAQSGQLITHKRTHSGEKPFLCDKCDKAFADSSTLQKHKLAVHDGVLQQPCPGATGVEACPYGLTKLPKYDDLCVRCFVASFPNDARATNARKYLHAKELSVRAFLEEEFPSYRWIFDRTCAVGVLVRPDAKAVLGKTRLLIVEIDENSHDSYVCAAERDREQIIAKHAPRGSVVHLLRFNPDAYDDARTGTRVPSCFHYSKVEACVTVNPARQADWQKRLQKLKSTIQEIIDHRHEDIAVPACVLAEERYKFVVPIELFYDDVRRKWPDGNQQRLAALKRNAQLRKQSSGAGTSAA